MHMWKYKETVNIGY